MQARSERTVAKWKRRIADLINPDSAKVLAACIPELRHVLNVGEEQVVPDIGLNSEQSIVRLKSILGLMFQSFCVRSRVVSNLFFPAL
jgi:hypothetical protein